MTERSIDLQKAVDQLVLSDGNKTAAAKAMGAPRTTYLGWLDQAQAAGVKPSIDPPHVESRIAAVRLEYEDRIKELQNQLRSTIREDLTTENVRRYIFDLAERSPSPPEWITKSRIASSMPGVPTIQMSDFHWGETVNPAQFNNVNEYNLEVAHRRFEMLIDRSIDLFTNHMVNPRYPGIHVILGGDMVEGFIHDELTETNEGSVMEHVFDLFDYLVTGLTKYADVFGQVFVVCNYGNHGRMHKKPRHKMSAVTNYDWLLYNMLERHFKAQDDDRFRFLIPAGPDAVYRIYDTVYLSTHGDRIGAFGGSGVIGIVGPIARGTSKIKEQYNALGQHIDWVTMGHFHQRLVLDTFGVIVNDCLKGYDEFAADMRFVPMAPSQNMWLTHPKHGITFQGKVFLEKEPDLKETPWCSWKA